MKRHLLSLVVAGFIGGVVAYMIEAPVYAHAGSPSMTTFSSGQVLTAAALNDNFSHLHNTFTNGITNAHVNSAAAIAYSKLNLTNSIVRADFNSTIAALLPRAWVTVANGAVCAADPCTLGAGSGVSAVNWSGAGLYAITLSTARPDNNYGIIATCVESLDCRCVGLPSTTTVFGVDCFNAAGAAANKRFTVMLMDDN